jgi:hypothetical protein
MNGEDMILKAKETREVQNEIRSLYPDIVWPEPVLEPVFYGRFDKTQVDNRKLVLDTNTGAQFDIVSDQYELIPHEVATHNLLKALPIEFGKPALKFCMWQDGARFRLEATFPELGQFEVKKGDPVAPRVAQMNSLDRSTFYGTEFGAVELVCTNGLVAYKQRSNTQRRHVFGAEDLSHLTASLSKEIENFSDQMDIWKQWNQLQIGTIEELQLGLGELPFSENEVTKLLELPLINHEGKSLKGLVKEGASTVWALNSAATQYAAHEVHSDQRQFDLERKVAQGVTAIVKKMAA